MKIRSGIYTVHNGLEMTVTDYYGHGLSQEMVEQHRILSYPAVLGHQPGFEYDSVSDTYRKDILFVNLTNAYSVTTKLKFSNEVLIVWNFNSDLKVFTVFTFDQKIARKLDFTRLSDRFIKVIPVESISEIWEERTPIAPNISLPGAISKYKKLRFHFETDQ